MDIIKKLKEIKLDRRQKYLLNLGLTTFMLIVFGISYSFLQLM